MIKTHIFKQDWCIDCEVFIKSQTVFNTKKGEIEHLSFEDIEKEASKRIDLDALPETIKATATKAIWDQDSQDRNCLTVEWESKKGLFTQKYTPMHLEELKESMKKLDIKNLLEAGELTLQKTTFRIGFPRMIPAGK